MSEVIDMEHAKHVAAQQFRDPFHVSMVKRLHYIIDRIGSGASAMSDLQAMRVFFTENEQPKIDVIVQAVEEDLTR